MSFVGNLISLGERKNN